MRKLQEKRQFMSSSIGSFQWGNRFYPDITKEADSDGPPPTKHPELWTWPSVERSIEDGNSLEDLGKSLCDLDDDWSSIVKLFFLMLDCYHGANGYLSSHRTPSPGTSGAALRLIESRKHEGRVLIDDLRQHGLRVLQQQLSSPWFTDLLRDIRIGVGPYRWLSERRRYFPNRVDGRSCRADPRYQRSDNERFELVDS